MTLLNMSNIWSRRAGGWVLRGVELALKPGEVTCIFGPNGAGKSTLLEILSGGLEPQHGTVRRQTRPGANQTGWAAQAPVFYGDASGLEHVLGPTFRATRHRNSRHWVKPIYDASTLFDEFGLVHLATARVGQLSRGEQRMVENIRAIYYGRSLLFLDEPTGNLHPGLAQRLGQFIRNRVEQERVTVALVSHDAIWANSYCDKFYHLVDGRLSRQDGFPP